MSIHKYLRKSGTGYKAVVQISPTKQVSKKFQRKLDAEIWEREQRQQLANGGQGSFLPTIVVSDLAKRWVDSAASNRRERSSNYRYEICIRRQILPAFGRKRVMDLTLVAVEAWLSSLRVEMGLSAKTANLCLMILKKMLTDAVRWQLIRYNPIAAVKPLPQEERDFKFWNRDEVVQFLDYVRQQSPSEYPAFVIALYTGMRLGEIQALKWDAVDFENRQITVKRTYCIRDMAIKERTKSKRVRRIPINGPLLELLISLRNGPSELVTEGFDYLHASRRLRTLAEEGGIRVIRFHDLRHTFASLFVMSGGLIYKLQRLLGHSSIQMTERYSHLSPDHLADATEILNFESPKPADVIQLARS